MRTDDTPNNFTDTGDSPTRRMDPDDNPTVRGLSAGTRVFGRYVLESFAGRGGMGVVWMARDERLERMVALKLLPEAVAADAEAMRDLLRETRRCLELTHPNIVRVHDLVQEGPLAAISMEYIDGESLAKRKAAAPGGCLTPGELCPLLEQLCAALDYAHRVARVVHRDLKPANLLLTSDGRLKVTDFGIARSLSYTHTRLTGRAGNASGTLLYMSPQQLLGEDPAAGDDIYAFGATLYELLAGKPPFHTGDVGTQIRQVIPKPVNARLAALGLDPAPAEWEETIQACLDKEPGNRPQSVVEVAQRLGLGDAAKRGGSAALQPAIQGGGGDVRGPEDRAPEAPGRGGEPQPSPALQGAKRMNRSVLAAGFAALGLLAAGWWFFGSYLPARRRIEATNAVDAYRLANAKGGLIVRTDPAGADVRIGDFGLQKGPLVTLKEVKVGNYPVTVTAPGYEDFHADAQVKENDFAELGATLVRSTGVLQIESAPPGLAYALLGRTSERLERSGRTPARLTDLPTGRYRVTVQKEGWPQPVVETAVVDRQKTTLVSAEFAAGTLLVTSDPSGAAVLQNGTEVGRTPWRTESVPGAYAFEVRLKDYMPASVNGTLTAKDELRLNAVLEKLRGPENGHAWTVPDLGLEMACIRPGTFTMGSPSSEEGRLGSEGPQTRVTLTKGYWLGKTEVTQGQYEALMGSNPSKFTNAGRNAPVEQVSWDYAMEFCRKLTEQERAAGRLPDGYAYTLPTEAQWEYACRAGTAGAYSGIGYFDAMAWCDQNSGNTTHPVAQKQANAWGLYDMHGNVWEWCRDWHGDYPGGDATDPAGPSSGSDRVNRGGGWSNAAQNCRSALRLWYAPGIRSDNLGFRLALAPSPQEPVGLRPPGF